MADCFIGEIRMFGGNYAPQDWAFCDGQSLPISQNQTLFALIGVTYGGDGQVNFNLPDFRGRIPIHRGTGSGLTPRTIAQKFGTETVALTPTQLPAHTHYVQVSTTNTNPSTTPSNAKVLGSITSPGKLYAITNTATLGISPATVMTAAGNGQAHNNVMPSLCVSFIIALNGLFPTQS